MNKKIENVAYYLTPVILIAAFVLRLKNIWFGYPLPVHPDEPIIVESALHIIKTGDFNPHTFLYPSFNIYLQAILYKLLAVSERIFLGVPLTSIPEIDFYILGRAFNVLVSSVTIFVVYEIGRRLLDVWTGIAAICFISASVLHFTNSYYVTVDTSTALWSAVSCLMAVMLYTKGGSKWYYITGGFCAGLAISCKYTAFTAFLPILVAHVCQARQDNRFFNKNIFLSILAVAVAFLATTPYALLDYNSFMNAIIYQRREYSISHAGFESLTRTSLVQYFNYLFNEGYGKIPTVLAVIGALCVGLKNRSKALLLLSFPLGLFVFLGLYKVFFPRNIVPIIPFVALFSGYTVKISAGWLGQKMSQWRESIRPGLASFACGALLIAVSVQNQLVIDVKMAQANSLPDTRWIALQWIRETLPPGARIGREHYTPPIEKYSDKYYIAYLGYFGVLRRQDLVPYLDFVITSSSDYSRFIDNPGTYPNESLVYTTFFARNELIKEFDGGKTMSGPTIRIYKIKHE